MKSVLSVNGDKFKVLDGASFRPPPKTRSEDRALQMKAQRKRRTPATASSLYDHQDLPASRAKDPRLLLPGLPGF